MYRKEKPIIFLKIEFLLEIYSIYEYKNFYRFSVRVFFKGLSKESFPLWEFKGKDLRQGIGRKFQKNDMIGN